MIQKVTKKSRRIEASALSEILKEFYSKVTTPPELAGCFAKILIKISFTPTLSSPIRLAYAQFLNI